MTTKPDEPNYDNWINVHGWVLPNTATPDHFKADYFNAINRIEAFSCKKDFNF
jgi:hypothetical protein